MIQPSVGRIVLVRAKFGDIGDRIRPAIVTSVNETDAGYDRVDLDVFGTKDFLMKWLEDVQHGADENGLPLEGCWSWPPRVGGT